MWCHGQGKCRVRASIIMVRVGFLNMFGVMVMVRVNIYSIPQP